MALLAVVFIPVFILGLWPGVSPRQQAILEILSWSIWAAFAVEFAARLLLATDRMQMLRSSIFDLLIIFLPFLRIARGVRAVRVVRGLGRLAVAGGGTAALGHALGKARRAAKRRGDRYVIALVVIAAAAGAAMILQVEREAPDSNIRGFGDACWWAISTVTTVGYGDRFPTTTEGRLIAIVLMVLGLGLFSVVTARVATFFIVDEEESSELIQRLERIETMLRAASPPAQALGAIEQQSLHREGTSARPADEATH